MMYDVSQPADFVVVSQVENGQRGHRFKAQVFPNSPSKTKYIYSHENHK